MSDASQPEVDLLDSPEVVSLKFTGNRLHKSKGTWQFITNQGHPASIFGKYLFERRFEIWNFRNICCKIYCLPVSPRIFEHPRNGLITLF